LYKLNGDDDDDDVDGAGDRDDADLYTEWLSSVNWHIGYLYSHRIRVAIRPDFSRTSRFSGQLSRVPAIPYPGPKCPDVQHIGLL
jgi:hypothetical protein